MGLHGAGTGALLALALLCLLSTLPQQAQATFPGRPGLIVFSLFPYGAGPTRAGLYAITPGEEQPRQLTTNPRDSSPSFSPSGKKLVFSRHGTPRQPVRPGLYTLDIASGKTKRLTSDSSDSAPAFGPRGMIAFSRIPARSTSRDLFLRTGEGRLRRLTSSLADETEPVFTPNGKRIIFCADGKIYSIGVDGSERRMIGGFLAPSSLDVSPNGRDLIFASDGIWTKRLSGGGLRRLPEEGQYVAYSPGGQSIAYANPDGLWTRPADGSGTPSLVLSASSRGLPSGEYVFAPAWQPLPSPR